MQDLSTQLLDQVIESSGVVTRKTKAAQFTGLSILYDGKPAQPQDIARPGATLNIQGRDYELTPGGQGRLQLCPLTITPETIKGKVRVHCGYHKCLTEYSKKVYRAVCNSIFQPKGSFRHFFHRVDSFYSDCEQHRISSISGQALNLDRFEDINVVRFIRDPRDLLISAYYYHKRGAEPWCHLKDPTDLDWKIVNGSVPSNLPEGLSLTEYLNKSSLHDGLIAEMDFRRFHFTSMLEWPDDDSRVRLYQYENIIGNEREIFTDIFNFFGFSLPTRWAGAYHAQRFRAGASASKRKHIRNPNSGQWRKHFTPELKKAFNQRYGDVLEKYGYPLD